MKNTTTQSLIYKGAHYRLDEHKSFSFATPNSFCNHFNEDHPVWTILDYHLNVCARINHTIICVSLRDNQTDKIYHITGKGADIPAATADVLNQLF